jgi:hypothetical protein
MVCFSRKPVLGGVTAKYMYYIKMFLNIGKIK